MADPTTPTTPDPTAMAAATDAANAQTIAMGNLTQATAAQSTAYDALETVTDLVAKGLANIDAVAANVGVSLGNLTSMTGDQIEKFGLLSAAFVNARDAFAGFANVDYSGLTTFSDQIDVIRKALTNVPASQALGALGSITDALLNMGASQNQVTEAMKKGAPAVLTLADNIFKHADNMLRAQTAYVQMAARTGQLGDVTKAAGKDFKDLGTILEAQQTMLRQTREATGLTAAQTEKWYNSLGTIPGALNAVVNTAEKGGRSMSMLTAAIEVAVGTGRSQDEVMRDLNVAFKDYGLVGEKALQFSVRMSDVSTRLKAPIEDVTTALRGSADAFKMFVTGQESAEKSAESLAAMMNKYGKALESTGLSASQSIEAVSQMSGQVARLSIGQQAFISQQTGGPGGLQGAARQQLKTPGQQVEDAMNTLKKQFGQIVTVKDAAESEAAASQWVKQTAMLQSLLGPLAKDQQSANRLLEAMKNQGEGRKDALAEALKPTGVQDAAKAGLDLQQKSYSELTAISNTLEQIRDLGDTGSARALARTTAGGVTQATTGTSGALAMRLADQSRLARESSGSQVAATARGLETGKVKETAGKDYADALRNTFNTIKGVPADLKSTFDALKASFTTKDMEGVKKQEEMLNEFRQSRLQQAKALEGNPKAQAAAMSDANAASRLLEATKAAAGQASAGAPGAQVGTAARAAAARPTPAPGTAGAGTTPQGPGGVMAPQAPQTINIVGKFSIDCPTCGRPHDVSEQAKVNPQQYGR